MNIFRADLHCHTTCSDGSKTPTEIVELAAEIGLSGLSITDHDSIGAYATAIPIAADLGIELLSGVEFSAAYEGSPVHILGYGFSLTSPAIHDFCKQHVVRRKDRNRDILEALTKLGYPISESDLYKQDPSLEGERSWGRPHIAQAMIKKGYVKDLNEAFKKYIGDGKSAFVSGKTFSVEETIKVIHEAHGFAVLAHPMLFEEESLAIDVLKFPFDGIEAYYARYPIDKQLFWKRVAEEKGLMITGGSDFHGNAKPKITLGSSWVGAETFKKLQQGLLG
jgi:predicted metal-dependent phosphoesterase TrpH